MNAPELSRTNHKPTAARDRILIPIAISIGLAIASIGCAKETLISLTTRTDEFTQNSAAQIDILWVVDNSSSMSPNQQGIGQSFRTFIDNLLDVGVDYHIGVVSTDTNDNGFLHSGQSGYAFIDQNTPNPDNAFISNVTVGINGSLTERAFESTALTLGVGGEWAPSHPATPPNTGFLRQNAALFIIMVSDEDDKSFGPVSYYRRLFESYKGPGNENLINVSAIVGDPGDGCFDQDRGNAEPGDRYIDLASQTGGVFASICDDFSQSLQELSISATGLSSRFVLGALPNAQAKVRCGTLSVDEQTAFCVTIDGEVIRRGDTRTGWMYDQNSNAIVFGAQNIPGPQAKITVEYKTL